MAGQQDKQYYLNNPNLPRSDAKFDYAEHPEWVVDIEKCKKNILYFAENFFFIVNLDRGKEKIKLHSYQKRILKALRDNRFVILLSSRQSGKTSLMTIYALWIACFFEDQRVLVVANKEATAINIFKRIRLAYEQLPAYLKPGIDGEYGKTAMALANGSSIGISTTSSTAGRGESCNVLILDELAFIEDNMANEFFRSVYPIISSSKKSKIFIASCVTGDTFVYTPSGIKQISDFVCDNKTEKAYETPTYSVLGRTQVNNGKVMVNNGLRPINKIRLTSTNLNCSFNHKLWACKDGKYGWYESSQLKVGDYLSIQYGQEMWGNNDDVSDFTPKVSPKIRNQFIPKIITPDIAYFLGLYIAEGSAYYKSGIHGNITAGNVTISCGDTCIMNHLQKLGLHIYKSPDSVGHYISSINLVEFLTYLGFDITKKAPDKIIPKRLLSMSRENIIALLQGIFDGDGHCSQDIGRVGLSSTSKILIDQVRVILSNFGVLSQIYSATTPPNTLIKVPSFGYRLECNTQSSIIFQQKIGFRITRKRFNYKPKRAYPYNSDDILPHCKQIFKQGLIKRGVKRKLLNSGITMSKFYIPGSSDNICRHTALRITQIIPRGDLTDDLNEFLDTNLHENIKWEPIISIEKGEDYVYDFSLDNIDNDKWCHSVAYNGIIGHQTPNGTGNLFHQLYDGAYKNINGWHAERVDWWEVPGRDDEWKNKTIATLGSKDAFDQEYNCVFHQTGESSVDEELYEKLKTSSIDPEYIYEEGRYKLWSEPLQDHIYVAGIDVAEGVGKDSSVIQILDITDLKSIEQVAVFRCNKISAPMFTQKCFEILQHWGKPPTLIERNNCGQQIADQLRSAYKYDNLVTYTPKGTPASNRPGMISSVITKAKGIQNLRYYVNHLNVVKIRDIETINELKSFTRYPNGTWSAKAGEHDDLVLSLTWALFILDNDLVEKYFEVEYDENKKPLKVTYLDYGLKYYINPTKTLVNLKNQQEDNLPVLLLPDEGDGEYDDIRQLQEEGWKLLVNN